MRSQGIAGFLVMAAVLVACGPTPPAATPPPIPVASTPVTPALAPGEYILDEAHRAAEGDEPCPT
jgi:hypothetical protein